MFDIDDKEENPASVGKVAVITGAGRGIGYAIAEQLVVEGVAVVLNDIDAEAAVNAANALSARGGRCTAVPGDSGDIAVIDEIIKTAVDEYGRIDWAIANAGITTFGSFLDYRVEQFQELVKVNLQGTFFLAQRAARQLQLQGEGGRIVLMSSVTGIQHHPDLAAYGMSKAAIRMLAKTLGAELAAHGITVNAVAPGATQTERTLEDDDYTRTWSELSPTGRPATPKDVANTVLFLLSDQARQITAQTLVVDGGWSAVSPAPV